MKKPQPKRTKARGLSVPTYAEKLVRQAELKAFRNWRSFSAHVHQLLEADLKADPPSNYPSRIGEEGLFPDLPEELRDQSNSSEKQRKPAS